MYIVSCMLLYPIVLVTYLPTELQFYHIKNRTKDVLTLSIARFLRCADDTKLLSCYIFISLCLLFIFMLYQVVRLDLFFALALAWLTILLHNLLRTFKIAFTYSYICI